MHSLALYRLHRYGSQHFPQMSAPRGRGVRDGCWYPPFTSPQPASPGIRPDEAMRATRRAPREAVPVLLSQEAQRVTPWLVGSSQPPDARCSQGSGLSDLPGASHPIGTANRGVVPYPDIGMCGRTDVSPFAPHRLIDTGHTAIEAHPQPTPGGDSPQCKGEGRCDEWSLDCAW